MKRLVMETIGRITRISSTRNTPEEICLLVEQQLEVIQNRFPQYECKVYELSDHRLRVEISDGGRIWTGRDSSLLLVAFFSDTCAGGREDSSAVTIRTPPRHNWTEEISYADPEFTVNFISDVLERLGR